LRLAKLRADATTGPLIAREDLFANGGTR